MRHLDRSIFAIVVSAAAALVLIGCSGAENEDPADGTATSTTSSTSGDAVDDLGDATSSDTATGGDSSGDTTPPPAYVGLVINEVAASGNPDWVELLNTSTGAIDLSGVLFSDDLADPAKGVFEAGTTIAAGDYLAIDVDDVGVGFKLGSDEEFGIFAPDGTAIDTVDWAEGESPAGGSFGRFPNGSGPFETMPQTKAAENMQGTVVDPCGDGVVEVGEVCDGTDLNGERCATQGFVGGTLACTATCDAFDTTACEAAVSDVVLNEVDSDVDTFELYNGGTAAADIGGWYVTDDGYDPTDPTTADRRYDLPSGTTIGAGEFFVIEKAEHGIGLGNGGDSAILYDAADQVVDSTTWGDGEAVVSWCRIPDGTGEFATCTALTSGAANM